MRRMEKSSRSSGKSTQNSQRFEYPANPDKKIGMLGGGKHFGEKMSSMRRMMHLTRATAQNAKSVCKRATSVATFRTLAIQAPVTRASNSIAKPFRHAMCARMFSDEPAPRVKLGDKVFVRIEGRLANGKVFDEKNEEPQSLIVGDSNLIPGLEEGLLGMSKGQNKTVIIPPEFAFGPKITEDEYVRIPKSELDLSPSDEENLAVGSFLGLEEEGEVVRIVAVEDDSIIVDPSHELAGQTLHLNIEVVDHIPLDKLDPSERLVVPHEINAGDRKTFPEPGKQTLFFLFDSMLGDTLVVHYDGYLTDGKLFDSSRARGKPFEFIIGSGLVLDCCVE
ncbi:Peptidyl-prolyl cis-trans isomerase fkbp11 [Aphanomyces cochlioides]|nr:Peptidyl-prolyl cis-trans isomerase fkbp11 [Aphanomyces cochlioides]